MNTYKTHNDEYLWSFIREGDVRAFEELYHRYWKLLFYVAASKIDDLYRAEDIIQEVFADLWNRREKIEIKHSVKSFLAGATKFQVYKLLARQRKHEETNDLLCNIALNHGSPEEIYQLKALRDQIEIAVQALPERCRLVYELSRKGGKSHKEIGEALNISTKTVENQMTKALKHLRASIDLFIITFTFFLNF